MSNTVTSITNEAADRVSAPERVCYEAHWRDRSVFISAPCQSAREWQWHCLASAILLERLEDACVLAETILESTLQFFVSELPDECSSDKASPYNSDDGNSVAKHKAAYLRVLLTCSDDEVEIWLPAGAHSNVARHGEFIESSNLRWPSVSASIKIAHVVLDQTDASRLQQGALVLIPASWQHQWVCSVDVPQFERSIVATINSSSGVIELDYANSAEYIWTEKKAGQSLVTAYLDQTIAINPSSLLLNATDNNKASGDSSIAVSLAQASCFCRVNDNHFVADLVQVGEGFGLCIREFS